MTKISIGRDYQRSREVLGAYNAWKPDFYRIEVEGRPKLNAFPEDRAKAYYVQCFKNISGDMPVEILAYSVVDNAAYFVAASWDQTPVSVRRYFMAANSLYAAYFNENFWNNGYVFKNKLNVKKISSYDKVLPAVAAVHAMPLSYGLAAGYDDYAYTSYVEKPGTGIASLSALYKVMAKDAVAAAYVAAHNGASQWESFSLNEKENFERDLDDVLCDYGVADARKLPMDRLVKVVIDLNDIHGYAFDYILSGLKIKERDKFPVLQETVIEYALRLKLKYDEIIERLSVVPGGDGLIVNAVSEINARKGYSYDYILKILGFAYPNADLLKKVTDVICAERGLLPVSAVQALGLYDQEVIKPLLDKYK